MAAGSALFGLAFFLVLQTVCELPMRVDILLSMPMLIVQNGLLAIAYHGAEEHVAIPQQLGAMQSTSKAIAAVE